MGDSDIITLGSDEETDMADLIVGPNGTAMPFNHMRMPKLPLPAGKALVISVAITTDVYRIGYIDHRHL
jgi:hypothetical protein